MCRRSSLLCPPVIAVRTDVSSPSGHYIPGTSYQEIFIKNKIKKIKKNSCEIARISSKLVSSSCGVLCVIYSARKPDERTPGSSPYITEL